MPSVIQKRSYNSVRVFWLDRTLLERNILRAVGRLSAGCPEVQRVILFGSVAESRHAVSSDVDILIILKESKERFLDRPSRFKDFFKEVGVGVDLFVYTQDEIADGHIPLVESALKKGRVLFP
jgi:predicted nucleotidyltransferase